MEPVSPQPASVVQQGPGQPIFPMKFTFKKILSLLGIVLAVLVMWQWISSPMVVTVYGEGKVSVPATSATVTSSVSINADTPQNAIAAVKAKANVLKSVLMASGVLEEDISESQVTTYPANLVTTGTSGYQAAIILTAEVTDVGTLDGLVANLYASGASLVQQPVLNIENESVLKDEATKAALKDARSQVSKIALRHFKFIRKTVSLYEADSSTTSTSTSKAVAAASGGDETSSANGVFEIAKVLSVSYKLW